jgi:hypothetical protein
MHVIGAVSEYAGSVADGLIYAAIFADGTIWARKTELPQKAKDISEYRKTQKLPPGVQHLCDEEKNWAIGTDRSWKE